jgi:hypothetical protein
MALGLVAATNDGAATRPVGGVEEQDQGQTSVANERASTRNNVKTDSYTEKVRPQAHPLRQKPLISLIDMAIQAICPTKFPSFEKCLALDSGLRGLHSKLRGTWTFDAHADPIPSSNVETKLSRP